LQTLGARDEPGKIGRRHGEALVRIRVDEGDISAHGDDLGDPV
jgi:hypothetical protein